ncbi:MAG: type II secretion system protein N [bacterium]|nr:type II secretion system protein N [bacterium]
MRPSLSEKLKSFDLNALFDPEFISSCVKILRGLLILGTILALIFIIRTLIDSQVSTFLDTTLANSASASKELPVSQAANKNFDEIVRKGIFGAIALTPPPKVDILDLKPISKLPMILAGTYVIDGQPSFAIIENSKSKEQDAFTVGDQVFSEAKLIKIFPDRVEIERLGQIETLLLDEGIGKPTSPGPGGVATIGENEFIIDNGELNKALENLPLLLQQARAVPYFKNGQSVGLRLFAIKPDSLYTKIGLKNGDIMMSINGKSLADLSEAIKLFETLKEERSFTLALERNRETREFKYEVR